MFNTWLMVGNNMDGLGRGLGREARNLVSVREIGEEKE